MQSVLYELPAWFLMLLIIAASVALACTGNYLVHRRFRKTDFIAHNEVGGFVIAIVGTIYAVLLGFLTVIVWQRFADSEERAQQEVNAATDIARLSRHLKPADEVRLRGDLGRYISLVVHEEWPAMREGRSSARTQDAIVRVIDDVASLPAASLPQSNVQNALLERVQTMADLRRRRISANTSGVPFVMWLALLIGAVTVIAFVYLFGVANFVAHQLMTAAAAIMIGLAFALIVALDYPFRGDVSVSPERWSALEGSLTAAPATPLETTRTSGRRLQRARRGGRAAVEGTTRLR